LMNAFLQPSFYKDSVRVLAFAFSLACCSHAQAQPYIVSTVPEYAATGVSPAASAAYTFSEAMTPGATAVQFYKASPLTFLAVSNFWSLGNTVLTCTPMPAFPANSTIFWNVSGATPAGDSLA